MSQNLRNFFESFAMSVNEWIDKQQSENPWLPRVILSAIASVCAPDLLCTLNLQARLRDEALLILQIDGFYPDEWEDVMKRMARDNSIKLCRAFVHTEGAYASFLYEIILCNKALMAKEDCVRKYWNKNIRWVRQMGIGSYGFPYREEDMN